MATVKTEQETFGRYMATVKTENDIIFGQNMANVKTDDHLMMDLDYLLGEDEHRNFYPELKMNKNDSLRLIFDASFSFPSFRKTESICLLEELLPAKPPVVKTNLIDDLVVAQREFGQQNKRNFTASKLKGTSKRTLMKQNFIIHTLKPNSGNKFIDGKFAEVETLTALFYSVIFFNNCARPYSLISQHMGGYRSRTSIRRKIEKLLNQKTGKSRFGLVKGSGRDQEVVQTITQTLHNMLSERLANASNSKDPKLAKFSTKLADYRANCPEYTQEIL